MPDGLSPGHLLTAPECENKPGTTPLNPHTFDRSEVRPLQDPSHLEACPLQIDPCLQEQQQSGAGAQRLREQGLRTSCPLLWALVELGVQSPVP